MSKARKAPNARGKATGTASPLKEVVGNEVYNVWLKMHKKLVPDGRTHRLSVLVASMLAYASSIAWSSRDEGDRCGVNRTHPLLGRCAH